MKLAASDAKGRAKASSASNTPFTAATGSSKVDGKRCVVRAHVLVVAVVLDVGAVQGTIAVGQSEDAVGAGTVGA